MTITDERLDDLIAMLEVDELGIRKDSDTAKALRHYRELRQGWLQGHQDTVDARRYRWLRESGQQIAGPAAYSPITFEPLCGPDLDAAIDAAPSPPEVTREA